MHRLNPLEILETNSPTLFADAKFIAEGLIALSGSGGGKYFELRSREWLESLLITIVLRDGKVTFASLMREINSIEGNPIQWAGTLEFMMACYYESIRRTASEMLTKQQDNEREFGAIMGEIYAYLNVFNDPLLEAALDGSDVSLKDFDNLFLTIPAEYVGIWAPLLRTIFTVAMLFKGRNPDAPRLHLIVDEAGQLGKAEFLMRAFTFGRGAGVRCWAVFQDTGQIKRNYGTESLQGFLGSAQTRIFFGIRDLETAEYASRMLGDETLEYDDNVRQSDAKYQKKQIVQNILEGANPSTTAHHYQHLKLSETSRTKQTRRLMTPSEILAMPEDRAIVFVSGKNLKPLYLEKRPYYEQRDMAGLYLPNPYHPPVDKVLLKTFWGNRWHKIITGPVPKRFAHLSQHSNGSWRFVKGYEPK
jgi:type IV secretion system protein VirD4